MYIIKIISSIKKNTHYLHKIVVKIKIQALVTNQKTRST